MNLQQLKETIFSRDKELLTPDKTGKGFVCPVCNSGTGGHGTGMVQNLKKSEEKGKPVYTCWNCGTFRDSDIFDIIGEEYGITDPGEQVKKAAELLGIDTEDTYKGKKKASATPPEIKQQDLTADYRKWNKDIEKTDYHRGIGKGTLDRFLIGYCEKWVNPMAPTTPPSRRLIIPTSSVSYVARATDTDEDNLRVRKVGPLHLFNEKAFTREDEHIFIVEGEIDALSIIDLGYSAIGIGGTSGARTLLSRLEDNRTDKTLILALDNDGPGTAAQEGLKKGLSDLGIKYISSDASVLYGGLKDANECLNKDREAFKERLAEEIKKSQKARQEQEEHNRAVLESESVGNKLSDFFNKITTTKTRPIPTGFDNLDKILGGGLYPGLYSIGAISSLGKTTFIHQIADQIADKDGANKKVLFYSLEMDTDEIISKSISRLTFLQDDTDDKHLSMTTRGILTGSRYDTYTEEQKNNIINAIANYSAAIDNNLYIKESEEKTTYQEIDEEIKRHLDITGEAPIVIIDYLQIMTPINDRLSDKQAVDRQVTELKRLSRKYNIPVIAVSSLNRENYTSEINLAAYKESGAIEYTSDIVIGLQYKNIEYTTNKDNKGKVNKAIGKLRESQTPKDIEVKVLKNRNGQPGQADFVFYPYFNYFEEA